MRRSAVSQLSDDEETQHAHEAACDRVAALFPERWLRHYTRSKLRLDPVFATAFELLRDSAQPLLDVGCGVGLLSFYLRERGFEQSITGVDVDERKVRRASDAARGRYDGLTFAEHNAAQKLPDFEGHVAVLDVLHYLPPARQESLLREFAASVCDGAMLLLRDSPRNGSARFWMTYFAERFAQTISWNRSAYLHFPTAESIEAAFATDEFTREARATWGHTPFNNQLFIFRRCNAAVLRAE
jgi:2-polyprenyl-3-methyl-5-hydroxy-6-metoxy-1,4-benzoquinol methylase